MADGVQDTYVNLPDELTILCPLRTNAMIKRRDFLAKTMLLGAAGLTLPVPRIYGATMAPYEGRLLVVIQADGGWDVTSFCDPKVNQTGEMEITHWSRTAEPRTAGNITYAPFANNVDFFDKYFERMLVINGVDAQTNAHSTGVLHNWSGRNAEGFPTLTAMFAAHNAPDQPLSYVNFGGFAATANLIRFSRLGDMNVLRSILEPEKESSDRFDRSTSDMTRIREYRRTRLARLMSNSNLNRLKSNLEAYDSALESKSALVNFVEFVPTEEEALEDEQINAETSSDLKRQVKMTLAAFQAGVASAADLFVGGYDTHNAHDALHEPLFSHLTESIELLWNKAGEAGFADRLTLVIGSDFGRTPFYNAGDGKDHWPIGSVIVMEQNASWGNRVAGETDEGHNAYSINPTTLRRDDSNGTIIYPKHVHKALRRHLGLENTIVDADFQFVNTEDFSFFS